MKRTELAMMYFPMKTEAEARRMLSRWIYRCPELVDEFKKISPYIYKSLLYIIMYVPTWKSYAPASLQVASFYRNKKPILIKTTA